jgi:hypothetical protein
MINRTSRNRNGRCVLTTRIRWQRCFALGSTGEGSDVTVVLQLNR